MSNVTSIKTEKPAERIAAGLRVLADQIEKDESATRAIIVLEHKFPGGARQEATFFGPDTSVAEIVGMLEIAKLETMTSE